MKKNAIVLLHDYWHPGDTIEPLLPLIFDEKEWFVKVTDDPNYIGSLFVAPDLIINFKDGVANTSIPTTNWYTNDYCHAASDLVLDDPEDGTVERAYAQLPGATNRGHTVGQCHTTGMRDPAQYLDAGRNATMSSNAAR